MNSTVHDSLPCGIEYAALPLPKRHVVSFCLRVFAGAVDDPEEKLGLAKLVGETIDKGTERHTGRELSDAYDAIGASIDIGVGRETTTISCTVLPDHFERAVELTAEMLRTPTFPQEMFSVNVDLAQQELIALQDDPQSLADKIITRQSYGSVLGRYPLGEEATLARIKQDDLSEFWHNYYCGGRTIFSVAGAVEVSCATDTIEKHFAGFGQAEKQGRSPHPFDFNASATHQTKDLEQQQISLCWPGAEVTHSDFPAQRVMLGILSGGMSGRLFTEVREKQGLVYWVGAWNDTPRGGSLIFLGASTTPQRCDKTYATLLREVDRLADDVTQMELDRAITGILAARETRGDATRSQCMELINDLFFFGRPIPAEEKDEKIKAVGIGDIRSFFAKYPRDRISVVTLGPRALGQSDES